MNKITWRLTSGGLKWEEAVAQLKGVQTSVMVAAKDYGFTRVNGFERAIIQKEKISEVEYLVREHSKAN